MLNAMQAAGLIPDGIAADGEIHRVPVDKGKQNKDGWYIAVLIKGRIFGTYGRWDTGEKWRHADGRGDPVDADTIALLRAMHDRVRDEKRQRQEVAAGQARALMKAGKTGDHPYLKRKSIGPGVSRVNGEVLMIPMSFGGQVVNIQRIWPDGTKKYLPGARAGGCALFIPGKGDPICVCEGWATGMTINHATSYPVVVAFSAHNLIEISGEVRRRYPGLGIVICADNDKSGTGQRCAKAAAKRCGGVVRMPDEVGQDFNDACAARGIEYVRECIDDSGMADDCDSITMHIPDDMVSVAGLISWGMEACQVSGAADIRQYNFPVVLAMICRGLAGKFQGPASVWPTAYHIKVGPTSSGKTDIDRVMQRAISTTGMDDFYGATDFSSGPGLLRGMEKQSQCLITLDEVTYLFRRYGSNDTLGTGKMAALLELHTAGGGEVKKRYGDSKNDVIIRQPCLILTGNATPIIFDDLKIEDMHSGLLQRFDFFCYDGPAPYRDIIADGVSRPMAKFLSGLRGLYNAETPKPVQHDLSGLNGVNIIPMNDACAERLRAWGCEITDRANGFERSDSFSKGVVSRQFHAAIKWAMVHMASVRDISRMMEPMTVPDMEYGIRLAKVICDWKMNVLSSRVNSGEFDKRCKIFVEAIVAAGRIKIKPTGRALGGRRPAIKAWTPKEWDEVVKALRARGQIETKEDGKHTSYHLVRQ